MGDATLKAVKPIKFKYLSEDSASDNRQKDDSRCKSTEPHRGPELLPPSKKLKPNFSFEYSYPAVIFDRVCFSIDKTQQQANFLNECLFKLKRCVSPASDSSRQRISILKSVNLSVPYGSIFGLLGPSSCGKTTLLRCLVGLLRPTSGSIRLFCDCSENFDDQDDAGLESNCCCSRSGDTRRNKCKVPGSNVGYMPQDLGLYEDFTIRQLLTMFGRYMRMGSKLIASRIEFMVEFLDLPHVDREIGSLSGGQKRRVSFAIACLHMPPLIILDEPTVGVDPLLRKSIWKYLRRLASEENKTIIITTHYIEEAAQADQVALMRAGEILVQDSPSRIMEANGCKTLEEAFLRICNNVVQANQGDQEKNLIAADYKLYPQPKFNLDEKFKYKASHELDGGGLVSLGSLTKESAAPMSRELVASRAKAIEKLAVDGLKANVVQAAQACEQLCDTRLEQSNCNKQLSLRPNSLEEGFQKQVNQSLAAPAEDSKLWKRSQHGESQRIAVGRNSKTRAFRGQKLIINETSYNELNEDDDDNERIHSQVSQVNLTKSKSTRSQIFHKIFKSLTLIWALLYKNYRRNINSLPLLAFQFTLPLVQMISFSLCVGGRPSNIGLGLVNHDQPSQLNRSHLLLPPPPLDFNGTNTNSSNVTIDLEDELFTLTTEELLSDRYISFIDQSVITIRPYSNLGDALEDVRRAKLWAAMEISENFTTAILRRFDLENFYQLDKATIGQSVIKLYPDRSNKILDMICHRSLVNSYRQFLLDQFEHFQKLPVEVKEPIFSIKPNLISNSIDGYTESIAAGLLASLTYIMAAGLTTFIMVVERSAGILERTFTSGINPVAYLIAHAAFRSFVMMLQIAVVMFLTFYILQQPLEGSIWLAYLMLMTLNLTGISYGLLISSIVTDQNGAALTIVSSLVVKITLSGILWPFEAIPRWLRTICYIQPLTMPIQALKNITLKGASWGDRSVQLGFLVSISWLILFLVISSKRFKFYQH